jgi:cobalt-zinc-cadmium resistance protein CzcA
VRTIKVGFQTPAGNNAYIPLSELANISLDTGASYIFHERRERYMPVKFSVRERDLGSTVAEAQQRIARNVKLPDGYRIAWAGEFESLQLAKARLAIIVPISLALILVLLYGLFNSVRDSLMALAGIPFAAGGGVLALYFSGLDFSISAAVGFVSLFGVSVMNGILMHRSPTGGGLDRHRQPGAAAAGRGGGRWNVHWTDHLAGGRARSANAARRRRGRLLARAGEGRA